MNVILRFIKIILTNKQKIIIKNIFWGCENLSNKYIFKSQSKATLNYKMLLYHIGSGITESITYNFFSLKKKTLGYVSSLKISDTQYRYSSSCKINNIYSSAYALMIMSLYGQVKSFSKKEKLTWKLYFDNFQNKEDGLFYDNALINEIYDDSDWWGARHLALHLVACYSVLSEKPKYKFSFLEKYYGKKNIDYWIDNLDWNFLGTENDIDNQIMNIGSLMQYSRDFFHDKNAGQSFCYLISKLNDKINPNLGLWGNGKLDTLEKKSRAIQFAYHLFALYFYDNIEINNVEKIIDLSLDTQNYLGGYGVSINSSACEDIDSIFLLIKLSKKTNYKKHEIKNSLRKAFPWILANFNDDGGLVFRRNQEFQYGHKEMFSKINESAMFPTWFRTLTLAYLTKYLKLENNFNITNCPGYDYDY